MDNAAHLLDVHKDTIAVAVLRSGEAEPDERTIANAPEALRASSDAAVLALVGGPVSTPPQFHSIAHEAA